MPDEAPPNESAHAPEKRFQELVQQLRNNLAHHGRRNPRGINDYLFLVQVKSLTSRLQSRIGQKPPVEDALFDLLAPREYGFALDVLRLASDQAAIRRDLTRALINLLSEEQPELLVDLAVQLLGSMQSGAEIAPDTRLALAEALRHVADRIEAEQIDPLTRQRLMQRWQDAIREASPERDKHEW